jgi:hypothetical protein
MHRGDHDIREGIYYKHTETDNIIHSSYLKPSCRIEEGNIEV